MLSSRGMEKFVFLIFLIFLKSKCFNFDSHRESYDTDLELNLATLNSECLLTCSDIGFDTNRSFFIYQVVVSAHMGPFCMLGINDQWLVVNACFIKHVKL